MRISEIIWVTSHQHYQGTYYSICMTSKGLTDKQRKALSRYWELNDTTFDSYRLAQDIVNMARQQMKEKLK